MPFGQFSGHERQAALTVCRPDDPRLDRHAVGEDQIERLAGGQRRRRFDAGAIGAEIEDRAGLVSVAGPEDGGFLPVDALCGAFFSQFGPQTLDLVR